MNRDALLALLGRRVAYSPALARLLGVKPAVLLSQLIYWTEHAPEDGWIYKSADEFWQETGLTYREQQVARQKLGSVGILTEKDQRLEHRIYYRVDLDRVAAILEGCNPRNDKRAVRETTNGQSAEQQTRSSSVVPESTAESTSEITEVGVVAASPPTSPKSRIKFDVDTQTITGVVESDRERWGKLYPAVNLTREQDRAGEWLVNHPEKRRSNIAQFLANWFERAQNDIARGRKAGPTNPAEDWTKKPYGGKFG